LLRFFLFLLLVIIELALTMRFGEPKIQRQVNIDCCVVTIEIKGTEMKPMEVLKHEHKVILQVLAAAERQARAIEATGKMDGGKIEKMLDFFHNFADHCHHAKEEKHLFVALQQRGMSREVGPIAVMLSEHQHGRNRVKAVADALNKAKSGDRQALKQVRENLAAYVKLLKEHISKEDNVLFAMAEKVLTPKDQADIMAAFEKVEAEEMGEGTHEKYHKIAQELSAN
jgi:hemerythrin-like domain-containing protein